MVQKNIKIREREDKYFMYKVFFLGDFSSNTGPAIANKSLLRSAKKKETIKYSKKDGKFQRIIESFRGILWSDYLLICSKSNLNYLSIIFAKIIHKKIIYVIHGLSSYEDQIAGTNKRKIMKDIKYEKFVFKNSNKIICVSEMFSKLICKKYPNVCGKIDFIYNSVPKYNPNKNFIRKKQIFSIGGGLKRKNILSLSKAAEKLNLRVVVAGNDIEDASEIRNLENVVWLGHIGHEEILRHMNESYLYVQNSTYETFGLSVIEALYNGCNLLISNNVGCKELFSNLNSSDVIYNVQDMDEIMKKITNVFENENNARLRKGFNDESVSSNFQSAKLHQLLTEVK